MQAKTINLQLARQVKKSVPGFKGKRKVRGEKLERPLMNRGVFPVIPVLLNYHYSKTVFV